MVVVMVLVLAISPIRSRAVCRLVDSYSARTTAAATAIW